MVTVRASDPRLRLFRHIVGQRVHQVPDMVYRLQARGDWQDPAPLVPQRQRAMRTGDVRAMRRRVEPEPNAPQLIRLVQTPFVLDTVRPVRDASKALPQRVQIGDQVREPFSAARLAAFEAGQRLPFPNATDVHPPHIRRPRPSADAWLERA